MTDAESTDRDRHPLKTPALIGAGVATGMLLQGNSLDFAAFSGALAFVVASGS